MESCGAVFAFRKITEIIWFFTHRSFCKSSEQKVCKICFLGERSGDIDKMGFKSYTKKYWGKGRENPCNTPLDLSIMVFSSF